MNVAQHLVSAEPREIGAPSAARAAYLSADRIAVAYTTTSTADPRGRTRTQGTTEFRCAEIMFRYRTASSRDRPWLAGRTLICAWISFSRCLMAALDTWAPCAGDGFHGVMTATSEKLLADRRCAVGEH